MLVLLSPAKSLDYASPVPATKVTRPRLASETEALVTIMRTKTADDLLALMGISDELAVLNVARFADFDPTFSDADPRPALFAFAGDVYQGMQAASFTPAQVARADAVVRILSGLYGVLRPLDALQPYRLEMGTRLATARGASLYDWWGSTVTDLLTADLAASPGDPVVVNLASTEYSSAVRPRELRTPTGAVAPWISPRFEDAGPSGKFRVVSFHAKRARGEMAAWIVRSGARSASDLANFTGPMGYRYTPDASSAAVPVFRR